MPSWTPENIDEKRLTTMSPGSETRAMHDTLFLFGATGDLAQRYLFPSLLRLLGDGLLPEDFKIRALALSPHDTEGFRDILRPRLQQAMPMASQDDIQSLLSRIDYRSVDLRNPDSVAESVSDLVNRHCVSYLAIPPGLYISTCFRWTLPRRSLAPPRGLESSRRSRPQPCMAASPRP